MMSRMKTSFVNRWGTGFILATVATLAVLPSLRADTRVGIGITLGDRDRRPEPPPPRGYAVVKVGAERYYYHRGVYYRPGPRGYAIVRAPRGAIVTVLPPSYSRLYYGSRVYYRYQDVYYVEAPGGYQVVDAPVVMPDTPPLPPPVVEADQTVSVGTQVYSYRDGQFFLKTDSGLVWVEAPIGAVTKTLPTDAKSIWYKGTEFYEVDEVYFRKQPTGYEVIVAPWKK